mgnify:CR=1 FL=1
MIEQFLTQSQIDHLKFIDMYDKLDALIRFITTRAHVLRVFTWFDQRGRLFLVEVDIVCDCRCDSNYTVDVVTKLMKEIRKQKQFADLADKIYINCIENCEKISRYGNTQGITLDLCS